MNYQQYIDLNFLRTEMSCGVEFSRSGYYGFSLEKVIGNGMMICVTSDNLDNPKLYIKKRDADQYHIIPIPAQAVLDIVCKEDGLDCV